MKKLFSLFLIMILLSGCWDYKEIEDGITVSAISVDIGENKKYKIGMEIITGLETSEAEYLFSESETLTNGIEEIGKYLSGELYFGHAETLVFGKDTDTGTVLEMLEIIMLDNRLRNSMIAATSEKKSASDILLADKVNGNIIGYDIPKMIEIKEKPGTSCVYKLYERMKYDNRDCDIAVLELGEDNRVKYSGVKNIWKIKN